MKTFMLLLLIIIMGLAALAYFDPEFRKHVKEFTGSMQTSTKVYKWKDKEGNWQVTDVPPPSGIPYQEQEYLHDTNVLPPLQTEKE